MASLIKDSSPPYTVTVHPKVQRFIQNEIQESSRKTEARLFIIDLQNYPFLQEGWGLDKIAGREQTYRVRIGRYRIYYRVDTSVRAIKVIKAKIK